MTIAQFRKHLTSSPIGKGAAWFRADFHIHEPGSSDYEYRQGDASAKLGQAIDQGGYRFAVILKHQEFPTRAELESLKKSCPNTALIPGAEINVFVDALSKKIGKDYFFHCIVAVDPEGEGDYNFVLQKAKEEFSYKPGDYPAGFRSSILDLGKFFRKNGALFIPAHLHQSKGPENSRSIDDVYDDDAFLGFIEDGAFDALEVRTSSTAVFFDGEQKTSDGRAIPAAVCVASSDAHHHDQIPKRNRSTWIRAEHSSFSELKAALSFRHRVSLQQPPITHARIAGVHVKGAFIPEMWVPLNEGFNALIGSKGSGKTAFVECIRFALNTHIPTERKEQVSRHIGHVLGSSGFVECLVVNADGSEILITRRADAPDRISLLDSSNEVRHILATDEMPFPISILGWHEIEAVADHAEARIGLLDRIGREEEINESTRQITAIVEQARDILPLLQRDMKKLEASLKEMWELRRKRKTLQRLEQGDLLKLQQQYEWFLSTEQKLVGLEKMVSERSTQFPGLLQTHFPAEIVGPPSSDQSAALELAISEIKVRISEHDDVEDSVSSDLQAGFNAVLSATVRAKATIAASFALFRDEFYTPKVNALATEDREILTRQIQVLEETKRLPLVEQQSQSLLDNVRLSSNQIADHCDTICAIRETITKKRREAVEVLNLELRDIQLKFLPHANQNLREGFIRRFGEDGASFMGFTQGYGKPTTYENLKAIFSKLSMITLEEEQWSVSKVLLDVKFADIFEVIDDDDLEIALKVGKAGFVPIQNLSAGQRCVAVFPLLLRNSRGPLVIDQPEDNLDNRYIADIIGPDLLVQKRNQQFLVTSHNANLVVLTDADLIIHVDSDGAEASFPSSGFLSCSSSNVRKSVLDVLDGGEAALTARQRKYGTSHSSQ